MSQPIQDLKVLLSSMQPTLNAGVYVYCTVEHSTDISQFNFISLFRETEAITLIMLESEAVQYGLKVLFRTAWISLTVHSDLTAVGLTAAFASALGASNISCNVVAGAYHDHIFVPYEQAETAMLCLKNLSKNAIN